MKLFWKIFISVLILFLGVMLAVFIMVARHEISHELAYIVSDNKNAAGFLAKNIEAGYLENNLPLESLRVLTKRKDFLFWWIVRDDGIIHLADNTSFIGTSVYDYFPKIKNSPGPENMFSDRRYNYNIFIKTIQMGQKSWFFLLGFSLRGISEIKKQIIIWFAMLSLLMLFILGSILYPTIRHFTAPIRNLNLGVLKVGKGDLTYRVSVESSDELGQLANSFNGMIESLQKSTTSIINLNNEIAEREKIAEELKDKMRDLQKTKEQLEEKAEALTRAQEATLNIMEDLEETNKIMTGRELRMVELKSEVNKLSEELGRSKPYEVNECL